MAADTLVDEILSTDNDDTDAERDARVEAEKPNHPYNRKFIDDLLDKLLLIVDELAGIELYGYQRPFARRILESMITNDGGTLTALFSRQSGKTETVANTIVTAMVMLPRLAKIYPDLLGKFARGVWVGTFAPTDGQTDIIFGRMVSRLSSPIATKFFSDPDICRAPAGCS